ncbi:MAG TPA: hypothetical protein VFR91_05265 [Dyella sp.]|nr:hypothetical protein [Dyella sp.]
MHRFTLGWCLWLALALALALAPAAASASSSSTPYRDFLAHSTVRYGGADDARSLEGRLYAWASQGKSLVEMQSRAASAFDLPADLADALVVLTLERGAQEDDDAGHAGLVERYIALARSHPGSGLALVEAARTISAPYRSCDAAAYDRLLQGRPHADADRLALFGQFHCLPLLTERTSALAPANEPYLTLATEGGSSGNALLDLAVLRMAGQRIARDPAVPQRLRWKLRLRHLDEELDQGRLEAAVTLLPDSPRDLDRGLHELLDPQARLAVAAAHLALGQVALARAWRDDVPIPRAATPQAAGRNRSDQEADALDTYEARLLDRLLHPSGEDAFGLLVGHHRLSDISFDTRWANLWAPLYNRIAIEQHYEGFVEPAPPEELTGTRADAVRRCHRCAADLLAMIDTVAGERTRQAAAAPRSTASRLPAAVRQVMAAALAAPRPGWTEHPLPAAMRPTRPRVDPSERARSLAGVLAAPGSPHRAVPEWAARLPAGELVRFGQQGQRVVAITASQTLDPTGEVSAGGYWVSLSDDGGRHFHPPLYTGLRMFEPYVVMADSRLPMLAGDRLQLEVAVRQLDDEHVVLPPVDIPLKARRDDLYIDMPLAELARDSDGDGLTDIAEWAMLLDPHDPDTDGDGVPDGVDPLPQVAARPGDAHASALAAVLNRLVDRSLGAIVTTSATALDPSDAHAITDSRDRYNAARTLFIQAPAAYFAGIAAHARIIVLSPGQATALSKARGITFNMSMPVFEVSHDGRQALVVWSSGWAGGTFLLHRDGAGWKVEALQSWIT